MERVLAMRGGRVLLIEDNPGDARLIREMLVTAKDSNIELTEAGSLKEGLHYLSSGNFDAVLLDLNLPDSYGATTLHQVNQHAPQVPVVVWSELDDTLSIQALEEAAYLVKNRVDGRLLLQSLQQAIERGRMRLRIREQAEQLQKSETRLRRIVENNIVGIVVVDAEGVVQLVNRAAERLLGRSQEDLLGFLFGYPATAGETCELEITENGSVARVAEISTVELDWDDSIGSSLILLQDVTERIEKTDLIRQHQSELARVARRITIGEMATGLAHELNQPLAAIASLSETLQSMLSNDMVSSSRADICTEINHQARRAGDIIRWLRSFVRMHRPEYSLLNFIDVVDEIVLLVMPEAKRCGITLVTDISAELPAVYGNRIELQQVLLNLVNNAIDAMKNVPCQQCEIHISAIPDTDGKIRISVSDTGPGLDQADTERVFDPFFTTKPDGMGMGLAISKSIIESYGCKLWIDTTGMSGAHFVFTLPIAEAL